MVDVPKDMSYRNNERDKRYTYELLEFKEYDTFPPIPEDELMGLEFLLAEPSCNDGLVEPFLGVCLPNSQKCFVTEDRRDHKKITNGTETSDRIPIHEDQHQEDNDGQVQGTDEGILLEMNNLPSICEDYLFDCKLGGELAMLDCDSSKKLLINQPNELRSDNGKEFDATIGYYCNSATEMLNKSMKKCRNLAIGSGPGWQSSAILSHIKTKSEVVSQGEEPLISDSVATFSSIVNDGSPHWRDNDAFFTKKRPRKRPMRFIDEYSKYHSVHANKRSGGLSKNSKEKTARAKSRYQDCLKQDVRERKQVSHNEYMTEAIQVPFGPLMLKECSRKKASVPLGHEDCSKAIVTFSGVNTITELSLAPSLDERSDDNDVGDVPRDKSGRKHNRYWSEYEITILIEGVAKYGVGRWTEIKRGLFPPTTRRTSVDLKDKWRNLLKASTAQLRSKNEGRRVTHQQVPQSVLRQVKELAVMHPYPKNPSPKNALTVRC
uniref:Uncharacterized protein n=1 Tax=Kalanchoe fedtschenkoi TaxID=63787 RepID=A0A7N0ZXZ5_KALFE